MKTGTSILRMIWLVFKVSMMLLGALALMFSVYARVYLSYFYEKEKSERQEPVWEYALGDLVQQQDVEVLASELRIEKKMKEYEAVFRIPSEPAHQAFLAQIAARHPASKAAEPSPMLQNFLAEHGGEAPIAFDLFPACPHSNTSNPTLLLPGRNNTYYIRHRAHIRQ